MTKKRFARLIMDNNVTQRTSKYKVFIFLGIEILVVLTIFLLIFFAGRRTYTVTFVGTCANYLGSSKQVKTLTVNIVESVENPLN